MLDAKGGNRLLLCHGPDATGRIMRRADNQHALTARHGRLHPVEIHDVNAIFLRQWQLGQPTARACDFLGKLMVNRRHDGHVIIRLGQRLNGHANRIAQPECHEHPVRINPPAMAVLHPPDHRVLIGRIACEIPVIRLVQKPAGGRLQELGRREIHIRDPHRQPVFRRHTKHVLHRIPLGRIGAAPVNRLIKIHRLSSILQIPRHPIATTCECKSRCNARPNCLHRRP